MLPNQLGVAARSFIVVVAAACWMVGSPVAALSTPTVQASTTPGAPQSLTATADGPTIIDVAWAAPSSDGGSRIIRYEVEVSAASGGPWDQLGTTSLTTFQHSGLAAGTARYYRVRAVNANGSGPWTSAVRGTTAAGETPSAPRNLRATATGPSVISLDWDVPFSDGGSAITSYILGMSADGGSTWRSLGSTAANVTAFLHTGLAAGTNHHYRVTAVNRNGSGPWTFPASATTPRAGTPSAPRNLRATATGPSIVDLAWAAPSLNGGSPIAHYEIHVPASGGGWRLLATTLSVVRAFRDANAPAGTARRYRVRAVNANGPGAPAFVDVVPARPPGPPRDLEATAAGPTVIELDWSAPSTAGAASVTGYRIEVSSTNTPGWEVVEADTESPATSYIHTLLSPGTTYYYRVAAINNAGRGTWSDIARATTELRAPDAPGGLTAEAQGMSAIELDWTRPSSSGTARVTGYRIEWSSTGTGRWRSLVANTGSTTTRHTDSGLSPGTTRYYRVAAISAAGTSAWSNVADATTGDLTVPGAPTGLRATPSGVGGSTQMLLRWSAPVDSGGSPITGYRIERAITRGGPWIIHVASTGSATTTYLHTGLAPNTTRFYRVSALNPQGHGAPSNVAEGTTNAARPGQPRNLRARAAGPTSITLAWEAPASDGGERITGYTIRMRGPNDGTWITIPRNTGPQETTFEHTGLQPASAYRYQVAAINRVGTGQWSFEASTSTYAQAPGAPFNLTARAVGTSRIDLSWSAPRNTGGAPILGYRIEASSDGGRTWNIIIRRNTSSTGTTFSDLNLQPATTRHYRVAAINTAGTGPFSNPARATTDATVPGVPRGLDAEADGTSRIELSWRAPTSDGGSRITGYRIEVSEDGGARWDDLMANSHNTRTTYVHTGLEPATRRHYRVSAINRIGMSRASRVASAITDATVPDAPTGLTATAVTATQIDLFWLTPAYDGGATVTGYRIEVSENGTAWTDLRTNTQSRATAFQHTGLMPGSTRHYRVSAVNRVGVGAPSDTASAATDDPVGRAGRPQHPCPAACGRGDDLEHGLGDRPPRRRGGQRDGDDAARGDERDCRPWPRACPRRTEGASALRRATRLAWPPSSAAPPSRCP